MQRTRLYNVQCTWTHTLSCYDTKKLTLQIDEMKKKSMYEIRALLWLTHSYFVYAMHTPFAPPGLLFSAWLTMSTQMNEICEHLWLDKTMAKEAHELNTFNLIQHMQLKWNEIFCLRRMLLLLILCLMLVFASESCQDWNLPVRNITLLFRGYDFLLLQKEAPWKFAH